jgi:hypothetical protein
MKWNSKSEDHTRTRDDRDAPVAAGSHAGTPDPDEARTAGLAGTGTVDADRTPEHDTEASHRHARAAEERQEVGERRRREEFGGMHLGAAFFGWLVAIGMAVLLAGIIGAVAAAVGDATKVTQSELERESGTIGVTAAVVLLVVLLISYYTGGYVAGRMSRFNGFKQGLAVWLVGLAVVIVAAALGALFGSQYDIMNRVDVPDIPIPTDDITLGGAITLVAAVVATLVAALLGGKAGTRYHRKVDRTW